MINNSIDQIKSVHLPTIINAVWTTDELETQLILDGLVRMRDIQYVAVTEKGNIFTHSGTMQQENIIEKVFPLVYLHRDKKLVIGHLRVIATLGTVYQRLVDKVWVILLSNAVKTFLVAGFMFFIFQMLITKHLIKLAKHARNLNENTLGDLPTLDRKIPKADNEPDELDTLVMSFTDMQNNLLNFVHKLQQREENLRIYENIISETSDLMAYVDRNYIYRAVNDSFELYFQKPKSEIVGRKISDMIGDELFHKKVKAHFDIALSGANSSFTIKLPNKRNQIRDLEVNYFPHKNSESIITGIVANIRDISEQKEFERSRTKLVSIIEHSHELMAITDIKGALEYINEEGKMLAELELTSNQPIAQQAKLQDLLPDSEIVQQVLNHGSWRGNTEIKTLSGKSISVYAELTRINDPELDIPMNIAVVIHDMTDWNQVLHELKISRDNLESIVNVRTRELTNSNRELEAFAYSVSHDLRAPLRAINGFSQIMLDEKRDDIDNESKQYLRRINDASNRMSDLIDSLLNLSRVTRQNLDPKLVNVSELCRSIVNNIQPDETNNNTNFDIKDGMFHKCDESLMSIAFANLINNAVKYSAKKPQTKIKIGSKESEGNVIYFVADNGIGIDMKYANKIFQPFQRLHGTDEYDGTGIGLATVKRIIDKHAGKIWVESSVNQGSSFYFTMNV